MCQGPQDQPQVWCLTGKGHRAMLAKGTDLWGAVRRDVERCLMETGAVLRPTERDQHSGGPGVSRHVTHLANGAFYPFDGLHSHYILLCNF